MSIRKLALTSNTSSGSVHAIAHLPTVRITVSGAWKTSTVSVHSPHHEPHHAHLWGRRFRSSWGFRPLQSLLLQRKKRRGREEREVGEALEDVSLPRNKPAFILLAATRGTRAGKHLHYADCRLKRGLIAFEWLFDVRRAIERIFQLPSIIPCGF